MKLSAPLGSGHNIFAPNHVCTSFISDGRSRAPACNSARSTNLSFTQAGAGAVGSASGAPGGTFGLVVDADGFGARGAVPDIMSLI